MCKDLFLEFLAVSFEGNQSRAATALDCDRSLVNRILSGERGITPAMAEKIELLSEGRFRKEAFIWPTAPAQQGEAA
jgi:DNA-binding transcriptional regulator YdaS (Cro superfamily)